MLSKKALGGVLLTAFAGVQGYSPVKTPTASNSGTTVKKVEQGSQSCSSCHFEIYQSYGRTAMANTSGFASDGVTTGEFNNQTSGVKYRVYKQQDHVWISYQRESEKFRGQRELLYFIGSGKKGRRYLFSTQGFLFQAPIEWSSQEGRWGMTPGYSEAREIPMNVPAAMECLNCHSSELQPPGAGTDNKFSGQPFGHGGISCERCHGAGEGHGAPTANSSFANSIVNPAKLPPERREAVCMECHFTGAVAVEQPGKHLYQFQPGGKLSDYIHYFLLSGNAPETPQALSQFEALSFSECKRRSGDKMWCGSCHDPHSEPGPEERAAYYRGKCLNCHGEAFAAKHHSDKPDCAKCHMPALPGKDVTHTERTDHRILRYPNVRPLPRLQVRGPAGAPLVSFPEFDAGLATSRDFALAWESLAQRNVEGSPSRAEGYLRTALQEREDDPALLAALGLVEHKHGHEKLARELYERALRIDPLANGAAAGLGLLEAQSGNLPRAVELWSGAFERMPHRSVVGLNLAIAFCAAGQKEQARKYVERVLEFNPDYLKGKQLLEHLKEEPVQCKP